MRKYKILLSACPSKKTMICVYGLVAYIWSYMQCSQKSCIKTNTDNKHKILNDEKKLFPTQNLFFSQPLFCQHLISTFAKIIVLATSYFCKRADFSIPILNM